MEAVFLKLLNMSITASWLALAVIVVRLLLKKAPKAISVLLWALVGIRLVCPFSFESIVSLVPSAETVPQNIIQSEAPAIESGVPIINSAVNHIISENLTPEAGASVNPMQIIAFIACVIWIVGVLAMLFYTVFSYLRIERKVREAAQFEGNIWLCDHVDTPFILGIVRPRIYLPSDISKQDMEYVIAHEKAHLKRRDHLWKPLAFMLLTVYWFNPVLWIAYILLCKDIELACDQKVLKDMGSDIKKPYSEALINCSVPRKMISACPLAFGEVGVKSRVKSVLNYKKPAFWIVIVAVITSVAVAVCFLSNPKAELKAINTQKSGSQLKGLTLEIDSIETSAPDPNITIKYKNATAHKLVYGDEHYIYQKIDGEWKDTRINTSNVWNAIAYMVSPGSTDKHVYNLNGKTMTQPGEYRFETEFFIEGKPETKYKVWIEFELKQGIENNADTGSTNGSARFIGKTVGDVRAVFGNDFKFGYYSGANCMEYVDKKIVFILDGDYINPNDSCKISSIVSKGDTPLVDNLNCNLTYNDLVEQLGYSVIMQRPYYWLDEMAGYYRYTLTFIYKGYQIDYVWKDDPNANKPEYIQALLFNQSTDDTVLRRPPKMMIDTGSMRYSVNASGINWHCANEDGTFTKIHANHAHPLAPIEARQPVELPSDKVDSSGYVDVSLDFEVQPEQVIVRFWDAKEMGNTSAESKNLQATFTDNKWHINLEYGEYVYEISARWAGHEKYSGSAEYVFDTKKQQ